MKDILIKLFLYAVAIWWLVMSGLCFWHGTYVIASLFLFIGFAMIIYFVYDYIIEKQKKHS